MTGTAITAFRQLARSRRSVKRFQTGRAIPNEILRDIVDTTLTAPSAFNLQPTNVILVRHPSVKELLAENAMLGAGNMYKCRDCSVLAVFCTDLEVHRRVDRIMELEKEAGVRHPGYMAMLPLSSSYLLPTTSMTTHLKNAATSLVRPLRPVPHIDSNTAWGYKNTSIAAQTYVLACHSYGLATCMMEGFDGERAGDILGLPLAESGAGRRYKVPLMVATGYEYQEEQESNDGRTPRLQREEVFFEDVFGQPLDLEDDSEEVGHEDRIEQAS